jgi:RNA polymerase sigma-70 factor (ECF subfamily)
VALTTRQVTKLLQAWSEGDGTALDRLLPVVHQELRRLARRYMFGERPDHTLQTTALVNEAYLRLVNARQVNWQNRAHFFALSAQVMRRILVDSARAHRDQKRGGGPRFTMARYKFHRSYLECATQQDRSWGARDTA